MSTSTVWKNKNKRIRDTVVEAFQVSGELRLSPRQVFDIIVEEGLMEPKKGKERKAKANISTYLPDMNGDEIYRVKRGVYQLRKEYYTEEHKIAELHEKVDHLNDMVEDLQSKEDQLEQEILNVKSSNNKIPASTVAAIPIVAIITFFIMNFSYLG